MVLASSVISSTVIVADAPEKQIRRVRRRSESFDTYRGIDQERRVADVQAVIFTAVVDSRVTESTLLTSAP